MKTIFDALETIQGTNIPAILIVAGIVFILLAMAGGFTGRIQIPKQRQKWAGAIGALLLILGLCLYAFPPYSSEIIVDSSKTTNEPASPAESSDGDQIPVDNGQTVFQKIQTHQRTGLGALQSGNLIKADSEFEKAETIINKALEKSPNDLMLLNQKAYLYKNWAFTYRYLKMAGKANEYIDDAEKRFRVCLAVDPKDPSALNGLGSVYAFRREWDDAEKYVLMALKEKPDYPAAKHDLDLIRRLRDAESPD